ncbi:FAD-binding oxidoreductase [Aquisalimonas lutea]|uniref:FAD-binding oxidoreductase n=1 Tax=Aquisalimonas lutea TaxID=1327750 RepID=UPI0025B48651|nr:FAD-binding oxidoreductase [Aquisalimonas lutea]MDN3516906.1 FAD-binding oxidoreductase [Aquisalimonas lutea]
MESPRAHADALARLHDVVGDGGWIAGEARSPYLREWRGLYRGEAAAVLAPASTDEVARVMAICHAAGIGVVPQSGNTGLCGGAAPDAAGTQVLLSMRRMRRIRAVDTRDDTLTAEAGCILADVQRAAAGVDRLFPLSLAAEGSCMLGGNLATNAGGINVLRYGNARDLCLGLEVVLADGRVWHGLSGLRKDNSRYDLRDLFIGSEGTLGIITAAVLRLFPRPQQAVTALLALDDPEAATRLLPILRQASGDTVTACEIMSRTSLSMATDNVPGCRDPFAEAHPWYLLVELTTPRAGDDLRTALEAMLATELEAGRLRDAVLAESLEQARALWHLRESIPEGQTRDGASIKHDISVAVARVPEFLQQATARVEALVPGVRVCPFGHLGDGNIHFNLSQPPDMPAEAFRARWDECNRVVHDVVTAMNGSIAAEHGVGQLKVAELERLKDPVELELMRGVKGALDPRGILNPGKVLR